MKIEKLGIEWGAAYEEAQPVRISHYGRIIEVWVDDNHDLRIKPINTSGIVGVNDGKLELRVRD